MDLCSLSITYAGQCHYPTATMGHLIHNVDISKLLTHTMPYTLSAICPVQWKPGFIGEEKNISKVPDTVSDSLCRNSLIKQTDCCSSCLGGCLRWSWRWRCWMWRSWAGAVTCGLWLWGWLDVLANSPKRLWRRLMVEKLTFNSRSTALVDIPAVSMPFARSLKTCDICGIVLCEKTANFRVAFYCGQPKAHLCNNHAV